MCIQFLEFWTFWFLKGILVAPSTQDSESCNLSSNLGGTSMFCNGGGFLSVKECFQWDRVPSILPMRTNSQGNEVILSTYYHSNLIRTTPLLIKFCLSKFKTKINQVKLKHHLLQDTFTIIHETNNQWDQTGSMSTNCLQQLELQ